MAQQLLGLNVILAQTMLFTLTNLFAIAITSLLFSENLKTKRTETLLTTEVETCSKCHSLEQLLIIEKSRKKKRHHDGFDESSVSSCDVKTKKSNKAGKQRNQDIDLLCGKINDFMIAKDQERNVVENINEKLKQYEKEVLNLRDQLREKDETFLRHQYEDNIR